MLDLRVKFAREQIMIFKQMREEGIKEEPAECVSCLGYIINYYPSGSKQIEGHPLDQIVETARAGAAREVISYLREKTGKDFGDDPQAWLDAIKPLQESPSGTNITSQPTS
ncbi:MAG TPA: hypothetical protein PLV91_02975 [Verrucomicrobiota bacterium]|jgi:hypothetical protein|nr:hypothetical protein [Verrucomicrobiota bacterium]